MKNRSPESMNCENHVKFLSDEDDEDILIVENDNGSYFTRLGFLPTNSNLRIEIPNAYNLKGQLSVKATCKTDHLQVTKAYLDSLSLFIELHTDKNVGKVSKSIYITGDDKSSLQLKLIASFIDISHGKPALKKGVHLIKI